MGATFTLQDGTAEVVFGFEAPKAKVQDTLDAAAEWFWDHGHAQTDEEGEPISFDTLTNQEKLDIVDKAIKRYVLEAAQAHHTHNAADQAREAAQAESGTIFDLGE